MSRYYSIAAFILLQSTICKAVDPAPISLNFGNNFFGTDGQWSAAQIRVGTPEQWVSVYPATVNSDTWVIGPGGCNGTNLQACWAARGGDFSSSNSTSYTWYGQYNLVQNRLGFTNNYGDYGSDKIAISDTVSASGQTIATVIDPQFWLGQLGLGNQEPRFDNSIDHLPFIASLVQNYSAIPSRSYGYTAGAIYQQKQVPGSLVLGGYDTTRFTPSNVEFELSPGFIPNVAVQSITVGVSNQLGLAYPPGWTYNPQTLLQPGSAGYFTIDSSTPFLWLPEQVCDNFAQALNLTYDVDLQLYKYSSHVNDSESALQRLKDWGITFTFSLANSVDDSSNQISIPISFNAFNLQLTYGYPGVNSTEAPINYFPLRRANSSSQYTIGRAFLQETYLIVDYESNQFSVSPALFPDVTTVAENLVAISPPPPTGLSTGAKAGIAIVMIAIAVAVAIGIWFYLRSRKRSKLRQQQLAEAEANITWHHQEMSKTPGVSVTPITELSADLRQPSEMLVDSANTRFELPGHTVIEMPAAAVPPAFLSSNQAADGTVMLSNDQLAELGLQSHPSIRKDYNVRAPSERSSSPVLPPYSPAEVGRTGTASISEMTQRDTRPSTAHGTYSSAGTGVSPLGGYAPPLQAGSIMSPVSPESHPPQPLPSRATRPTTPSSAQITPFPTPPTKISRNVSHNSRFKENLGDGGRPKPEVQDSKPASAKSRYSWEQ